VGGWIIAYSSKPITAMKEIYRVTQPKGLAIISWDIPENIDDSFDCMDKIFLPMVNGNRISFNRLIQNWKINSLVIGDTSWSSGRRTLLVVLRK
jgi:ubiquinone/menaquinone biosynthesis C-methylase UbiE